MEITVEELIKLIDYLKEEKKHDKNNIQASLDELSAKLQKLIDIEAGKYGAEFTEMLNDLELPF